MIVCCGEALIDFLPRKGADGADVFQPFAGGSVFNVAIALGRLGAHTGFLSGLSSDFFGDDLLATLKASDVYTGLCVVSEKPTTLAFVTLTDGHARYAFFDEGSAGRMFGPDDLPAIPRDVTAMHFGSISLMAEPCGTAYETLMDNEAPHRVISLDPNVRPTLIDNRDGYLDRIDRMAAMSDIVKFSDDDLDWIAPEGGFEALAGKWLDTGTKVVILTRGEDGARALTKTLDVSIPAPSVTVADTIGAGDTFSAGFLAKLDQASLLTKEQVADINEADLRAALEFAAKAAAITASRPGADPPRLHEIA